VGDAGLGIITSLVYSPLRETATNKAFVDAWVKEKGSLPNFMQVSGYVAATLFLEAVNETDGDVAHDRIIEALRGLKVDTPRGKVSFTEDGMGIGDLYVVRVTKADGEYRYEILKVYEQQVLDVPK
jgi:branched-chain amino acid transport system substrate-binding protein